MRCSFLMAAGFAATTLLPGCAFAQVAYRSAPDEYGQQLQNGLTYPYGDSSPYDVAYGTRPSFAIIPTPNPYAPAVRVVERCMYPNGWNVTDFGRDINGVPTGIDHTCPIAPVYGRPRLHARY